MDALAWVIAANACVWLGIGLYVAFLAARQRSLAARLKQWETIRHED